MQPASIDAETKVAQDPADHKAELRLWLRLLTCTRLIENEVRRKLRRDFDFTLSRFDLLAQLDKASDGMVLGEVSKRLMVSPGNVEILGVRPNSPITMTSVCSSNPVAERSSINAASP